MIRFSDVRYALRLWRRHPAMIVVAGLSLGLGVGATTTMYSVVNRVAHYDLGFADEGRLVVVWRANPERGIREQSLNYLMSTRAARTRAVVRSQSGSFRVAACR